MQAVFNNVSGSTTTISGAVGSSPISLSVSVATGNGGVTVSVHPLGAQLPLTAPNPWLTQQMIYQHMIQPRVKFAYFASSSIKSRIVGYLHNSNGLDGDPFGELLTRTAIRNLGGTPNPTGSGFINSPIMDHENYIILPERTAEQLKQPLRVIAFVHGRTGYIDDFAIVPGVSVPGEPKASTCQLALLRGYAVLADQGGYSYNNQFADCWGNQRGTEYLNQTYDKLTANVFNVGKVYGLGQSMGGVGFLNFARQYPSLIGAGYLATPAIDLNDSSPTYGMQTNTSLKASLDAAYRRIYVSLVAGNTGNDPATDDGTHWAVLAEAGELPDIGGRSWIKTTVGTAATNVTTIPLTSTVGLSPGDWVYFENAGQLRRIVFGASGVPNSIYIDSPVTVASGDTVRLVRKQSDGSPDPTSFDYTFLNALAGNTGVWTSGATYAAGSFVFGNSSDPAEDELAWNPQRSPESFGSIPILIGVSGDGTRTGNDGILSNSQMYAFADAVNAIYPANPVTITPFAGSNGTGHVTQAMTAPALILDYFDAH